MLNIFKLKGSKEIFGYLEIRAVSDSETAAEQILNDVIHDPKQKNAETTASQKNEILFIVISDKHEVVYIAPHHFETAMAVNFWKIRLLCCQFAKLARFCARWQHRLRTRRQESFLKYFRNYATLLLLTYAFNTKLDNK